MDKKFGKLPSNISARSFSRKVFIPTCCKTKKKEHLSKWFLDTRIQRTLTYNSQLISKMPPYTNNIVYARFEALRTFRRVCISVFRAFVR